MTLQEKIDQFVSDGAYRIGEIGMLMDEMADNSNHEYQELDTCREQLSLFLSVLRHTTMSIIDGTSFLDWEEIDILREMDHMRKTCKMGTLPIINFLNFSPSIFIQAAPSEGGGSAAFPEGSPGDSIFYNGASQPIADAISVYAGMDSEDINTYFAGRP